MEVDFVFEQYLRVDIVGFEKFGVEFLEFFNLRFGKRVSNLTRF